MNLELKNARKTLSYVNVFRTLEKVTQEINALLFVLNDVDGTPDEMFSMMLDKATPEQYCALVALLKVHAMNLTEFAKSSKRVLNKEKNEEWIHEHAAAAVNYYNGLSYDRVPIVYQLETETDEDLSKVAEEAFRQMLEADSI